MDTKIPHDIHVAQNSLHPYKQQQAQHDRPHDRTVVCGDLRREQYCLYLLHPLKQHSVLQPRVTGAFGCASGQSGCQAQRQSLFNSTGRRLIEISCTEN